MTTPPAAASGPIVPRVPPVRRPLRFPANLWQLLKNNLAVIPEAAYREDVVLAKGPPAMAFITGPEALKAVLQGGDEQFPRGQLSLDVQGPLFGDALIQSHGPEWRWQRKAMAPLFRHEELLSYVPTMAASAEGTIQRWRQGADSDTQQIDEDMLRVTFDVITHTMLGGGCEDVRAVLEAGHAGYYRQINWWILYCVLRLPSGLPRPGGQAMRAHERALRESVRTVVHTRRDSTVATDDLLGRLLRSEDPESGRAMSEDRVVDNIVAFIVAGSDTTALALAWALYLLAQSPVWQARAREEVDRVAGGGPIDRQHLDGLVVVKQVLNETLRLFPTAPVTVRDIRRDVELGGVRLRAGTIGIIPFYAVHRHERFWRDPDRFDPDRFSPAAEKPGRYHFLPFGAGPRICIGAAFAMIEATVLLASFLRAATFELAPGFVPTAKGQMFLTPEGGLPMRIGLR